MGGDEQTGELLVGWIKTSGQLQKFCLSLYAFFFVPCFHNNNNLILICNLTLPNRRGFSCEAGP